MSAFRVVPERQPAEGLGHVVSLDGTRPVVGAEDGKVFIGMYTFDREQTEVLGRLFIAACREAAAAVD